MWYHARWMIPVSLAEPMALSLCLAPGRGRCSPSPSRHPRPLFLHWKPTLRCCTLLFLPHTIATPRPPHAKARVPVLTITHCAVLALALALPTGVPSDSIPK